MTLSRETQNWISLSVGVLSFPRKAHSVSSLLGVSETDKGQEIWKTVPGSGIFYFMLYRL